MHVFFVGEEIPCEGDSGSHITALAIVDFLLSAGHEVTAFVDPPDYEAEEVSRGQVQWLSARGVRVVSLRDCRSPVERRSRWSRCVNPMVEDFFPAAGHEQAIRAVIETQIETLRPDILVPFGVAAMSWVRSIRGVPKFAPICENIYKQHLARWRYNIGGLRKNPGALVILFNAWRTFRLTAAMHAGMDGAGQFCLDWLEDSRRHGVPACKIYHMPVLDNAGANWRARKDAAQAKVTPPRILLAGASSTFTLMHLHVLQEILPELDRQFPAGGFEVHLVGRIVIPDRLRGIAEHPAVRIRGYVDDIDEEFAACHVLLVPTPMATGSRSRIIKGLSFGCCLVTTSHEQATTPGLVHDESALITDGPRNIARMIRSAFEDETLRRRTEAGGRHTYETRYVPNVAVGEMADEMQKIVDDFIGGVRAVRDEREVSQSAG